MNDFLKDWDNRRKYEKLPFHRNLATVGHLIWLADIMSSRIDSSVGAVVIATNPTGSIAGNFSKNTFRYEGTQDGVYQLPDPTTYPTNGIFVINKTTSYLLTLEGDIWDFAHTNQREVQAGEIAYFISDGAHWTVYN